MPAIKGTGQYSRPTWNQARKVITKFGGEARLAAILGISRVQVYRWNYQRPVGTNGLIPSSKVEAINAAARLHGILITPADWLPERISYEGEAA